MSSETAAPVKSSTNHQKPSWISIPALVGGFVAAYSTPVISSIILGLSSSLIDGDVWVSRWAVLLEGSNILGLLAGGLFAAGFAKRSPVGHAVAVGFGYQACLFAGLMLQADPAANEPSERNLFVVALIFSPAIAALGGLMTVGLDTTGYRSSWVYRTSQGREILATGPRRNPWAALIFNGLGLLLLTTCWIPAIPVIGLLLVFFSESTVKEKSEAFQMIRDISPWTLIPSMVALGIACRALARKRSSPSVEDVLETDLPPVVYLRSFQDDGLTMERGMWFELMESIKALRNKTFEQRLAWAIGPDIPFIAIGRPGEVLPELGAARMYVSDDDWQAVVADMVSRAALVILQGGRSPGLLWELNHVGNQGDPARLLLSLPIPHHRNRFIPRPKVDRAYREGIYGEFRGWAEGHLPASLPEKIGESSFVYFSRATNPNQQSHEVWVANCLNARFRTQPSIPISGFLDDLRKDKAFVRPPLFSWPFRMFFWSILILSGVVVVTFVLLWFAS